jgi:hypothetical protein
MHIIYAGEGTSISGSKPESSAFGCGLSSPIRRPAKIIFSKRLLHECHDLARLPGGRGVVPDIISIQKFIDN